MPETYHVKLSDGREFDVTTEGGAPSEDDVLASLPKSDAPQFGDKNLHPTIGTITDDEPQSTWKDKLGAALEPIAHPRTASDLAPLLIPAGIGTVISAAKGYTRAVKTASQQAKSWRAMPKEVGKVLLKDATTKERPIVGFDRYAPSISSKVSTAYGDAASVKGPAQAVFTQLADGSWGIKGSGLKAGESVNVMNRAGNASMHTVGSVLEDGTATIAGAQPSVAKIVLSASDVLKVQKLTQQGVPEKMAVDTVLKLKKVKP